MSSSSTLGRLRWYLCKLFKLVIDRTITTQPLFSGICKEAGTHAIFRMHNLFKSNIIIYFQIQYGGCVIWDCWSENASSRIKLRRSQITKTTGHLGVQVDIDITGPATGSELFSLLTCFHTTTFPLLSIFSPSEMISTKIWETPLSWHVKCSLPVAVRVSKTRVLKLPIVRSNTRTKLRAWLQKIEIESLMYPSILLIFTIYYFYLGLCAIVPPWALGPSLSGRNNSKKS